MSYTNVEDALASQLNSVAGFSTAAGTGNVTKGDYRVFGRGVGSAVVIEYDGFEQRRAEQGGDHEIDWRFNLGLFTRVQDEGAGVSEAGIARQAIIDRINEYPNLGTNIIFDAMIQNGDAAPEDIEMGGVRFAVEFLRGVATEMISVSYAE